MSNEKCLAELPKVRVPDELRDALIKLSVAEDRSLSDYVRYVLSLHVYGHARRVGEGAESA
jgi:hypothetical protein